MRNILFAVACAIMLPIAQVKAQVDPRGTYRTFHTPHFRVHFHSTEDSIARRAAVIAEEAYSALSREMHAPDTPIELLLADNLDLTNGFAQAFPTNRIVLYLLPPAFSEELRYYGEWMRLVMTHELTHIFQVDRARGVWAFGRHVFGRSPVLFPNGITPSWVKEGLAVYYETRLTGLGRDASTAFPTVARAAALEGKIPSPNQWSLATSRFPLGQTAYAWGSLLMQKAGSMNPDSGMRKFADAIGGDIIPFRLGRASKIAFGESFNSMFHQMRDSMYASVANIDTSGDARWRIVSNEALGIGTPRWGGNDTLLWAASTGRQVSGLYRASLANSNDDGKRIARRNSLDANVPSKNGIVFAQGELRNPYVFQSDLYRGHGRHEKRLTNGARLAQPDVRGDGGIVAAQAEAGATRLVRVSPDGRRITPLTRASHSSWTMPRWSPAGDGVAAVELLPTGEQRVVVLDTLGHYREIVAGGHAVFGSPSFTPDGKRLVWVSDRSGRSQLETAVLSGTVADTNSWRDNSAVHAASNVSTAVYEPSVSPDGRQVAALLYRNLGYYVAVAPLDTTGPLVSASWYTRTDTLAQRIAQSRSLSSEMRVADTLQSRPYRALRQLVPHYWMPEAGVGRVENTYGVSSSGVDIAGRHEWYARALFDRDFGEMDAFASYRFAGAGVPLFDVSLSQEWDATFHVVDTANVFIGDIARRRRFATLSTTWVVPRVRRSLVASVGTQFELRKFVSDSDDALGGPGSITRRGTQYHSFFGSLSASTTRASARAISAEEGFSITGSTAYRWRTDVPQQTESWRTIGVARGFIPLPLPGYSRHVLAMRVAAGSADRRTASEFSIGGVSGVQAQVLPGVNFGEPSRTFAVRGVEPGVQRGSRALSATLEYRAPLALLTRAPGPLPLFGDRVSLNLFGDAGRAWCPAGVQMFFDTICDSRKALDGWIATVGGEISIDLALQYDVPYRLRGGIGVPVTAPSLVKRRAAYYVTLGSFF